MSIRLLLAVAVALSSVPAWAVCGFMSGGYAISDVAQIKGTHYDAAGNATKLVCDTKRGDSILVDIGMGMPPLIGVQLWAPDGPCAPLSLMVNQFASFGPHGDELQVVKNGVAKRECVFHGVLPWWDWSEPSYWVMHTVRKFDGAGEPTSEKGSFTVNTPDGQMFIGQIRISYSGLVHP